MLRSVQAAMLVRWKRKKTLINTSRTYPFSHVYVLFAGRRRRVHYVARWARPTNGNNWSDAP
jgi:hypothetical protein